MKALFRKDDSRVVICTDNYVSHRRGHPWKSSFSISRDEAQTLLEELKSILGENYD